jgi:DNA-binding NarL/FixJ family response regulator
MRELIETKTSPQVRLSMANVPTMFCELLQNALQSVSDITLVKPINNLEDLLTNCDGGSIDVILIGSSRGTKARGTVELLGILVERHKKAKAIVLTENPDYNEIIALFRAGAKGILCAASLNFTLLCKCIRCVHDGQIWAINEYVGHLVTFLSQPSSANVTDSLGKSLLTVREQQVLHLLTDGLSNGELAAMLNLSEHTIKNHLFRIYDKLGVSTRMEAVLFALTPRIRHGAGNALRPLQLVTPADKLKIMKTG